LEPLTLLAAVVGTAISTALKPEAVIGSAIGGIIGNRVDAGFVKGFNGLIKLVQGGSPNDRQELQGAIGRSMIAAQQGIVKDCLGSAGLSDADRGWLQARRRELDLDLKELVNLPQEGVSIASGAIDGVALGRLLLPQDADETRLLELRGQLVQVAELPGAPVVYLDLVRSSFFERVCACFGAEVRGRSGLRDLLELQLLGQIGEQMLTIDDLAGALQQMVVQPLEKIDRRLERIEGWLQPPQPLVLPSGATLPPNPFVPFKGRIDDPSQFFAQDKMINRVFATLNSGSSVALIGKEGMGKSSLLKEIERLASQRLGRQAIYIDWYFIDSEDTFWDQICDEIKVERGNNYLLSKKIKSYNLLLMMDQVAIMKDREFGLTIRQQLRAYAEGSSMKLVVAVPESLDRLFPEDAQLQSSPFAGIFTEEALMPWQDQMMRDYIYDRLTGNFVRFTETEINQIIRACQGHPQKFVESCNSLYCKYLDHHEHR
jgi:energy-coupling factor transporter ATP-binding protein EcfA2